MRATQPGRMAGWLVAVLSINFNPTNCLEFIKWAFETTWSHGKQHNNMREKGNVGFLMMLLGVLCLMWTVVFASCWCCLSGSRKGLQYAGTVLSLWIQSVTVGYLSRFCCEEVINDKHNVIADLLIVTHFKFEWLIVLFRKIHEQIDLCSMEFGFWIKNRFTELFSSD